VFDDLTYHAASVAHWIRDQTISETPWNAQAYYPRNGELLSLWFVLPFGSDAYASLAGLYWLLLLSVAVLYLSRRVDVPWTGALMAATLSVGAFKDYAASFAAVDLAVYAALIAAIAFSLPGPRSVTESLTSRDAAVSGVTAGIAAGTKLFAGPGVLLLFLWWCFARRDLPFRARASLVMWFSLGTVALGSFWYVRTFVLTGNPFFPANIGPFAGMADLYTQTRLLDALLADPLDASIYIGIAKAMAAVGLAPLLIAAAGYSGSIERLISHRHAGVPESIRGVSLLLLAGAIYFLFYPLVPFSGFRSGDSFLFMLRYVAALVVPIGVTLFFWAFGRDQSAKAAVFSVGVLAIVTSWRGSAEDVGMAMIAGMAVLLTLWWRAKFLRIQRVLARPAVASFATTAFLAVLVGWLPVKQHLTDENLFQIDYVHSLNKAWQAIEALLPANSQVTWFGPRAFIYYPLFGRDFRLAPIRVRSDGTASLPFFQESREVPLVGIYHDQLAVNRETFVRNLMTGGIEYVLVTRLDRPEMSETWRDQLEALRSSNHAHLIYDDGNSWVWRLDVPAAREPGGQ
jgi:hypothetical protein